MHRIFEQYSTVVQYRTAHQQFKRLFVLDRIRNLLVQSPEGSFAQHPGVPSVV